MSPMLHAVLAGIGMAAIALVGSTSLLLAPGVLDRLITPLVAFAAGSLLGGALLHLQPAAARAGLSPEAIGSWTVAGFAGFFLLERLIRRHQHHPEHSAARPITYLILLGDGLHNLLGGLAIGALFATDVRVGWTAWLAAVAHEIPQELGDFGVLVHGGWSRRRALLFNLLSGSTFLLGAVIACSFAVSWDVGWLVPFAAGNFLYIAAVDLVPEVLRGQGGRASITVLAAFAAGVALMLVTMLVFG